MNRREFIMTTGGLFGANPILLANNEDNNILKIYHSIIIRIIDEILQEFDNEGMDYDRYYVLVRFESINQYIIENINGKSLKPFEYINGDYPTCIFKLMQRFKYFMQKKDFIMAQSYFNKIYYGALMFKKPIKYYTKAYRDLYNKYGYPRDDYAITI